jgi:deoxyribodipyrimidine photo-lyase
MSHRPRVPTAVVLFTRDLRIHDNPVLAAACAEAEQVVPLFVLDPAIGHPPFAGPHRASFLAACLADLDGSLRDRGGHLVVRAGDPVEQACRIAGQVDADRVHLARDVSRYASARERRLRAALATQRRELAVHDGVHTIVPPGELTPAGADHFAVFTPYFRRWTGVARRRPAPAPAVISVPALDPGRLPPAGAGVAGTPGGESAGRRRMMRGLTDELPNYQQRQDLLAADGTSRLSPYLHLGCLSELELATRAAGDPRSPRGEAFIRQLAWRDFHHQVLAARPDAAHADYRPRGDTWREDPDELTAWREGLTGYPIVDAGLRQLLAEGWMHNRARLITASFLTKTLYHDWRAGAAHFYRLLLDGDIADNALNWQWVAGTGTDTRPNRVLNPLRQAERFDPGGDYVRRWLPELAHLPAPAVHRPWRLPESQWRRLDYPDPIVDLDQARDRFLAARARS